MRRGTARGESGRRRVSSFEFRLLESKPRGRRPFERTVVGRVVGSRVAGRVGGASESSIARSVPATACLRCEQHAISSKRRGVVAGSAVCPMHPFILVLLHFERPVFPTRVFGGEGLVRHRRGGVGIDDADACANRRFGRTAYRRRPALRLSYGLAGSVRQGCAFDRRRSFLSAELP